jgi:hypothetical protein
MIRNKINSLFLAMVILLLNTGISVAGPLDKVQFIKISAQDAKAVIRSADGKMTVIKQGDTVVENITVKEIIPGRIILEEKTAKGPETIIVRIDNGKTRIERIRKQAEVGPAPVAPAQSQKQ